MQRLEVRCAVRHIYIHIYIYIYIVRRKRVNLIHKIRERQKATFLWAAASHSIQYKPGKVNRPTLGLKFNLPVTSHSSPLEPVITVFTCCHAFRVTHQPDQKLRCREPCNTTNTIFRIYHSQNQKRRTTFLVGCQNQLKFRTE